MGAMREAHHQGEQPSAEALVDPAKRWRSEFPYFWDVDDLVSRRELLQLAVYTSGALFLATGLLAALGLVQRPRSTAKVRITAAADLPEGHAIYFDYPEPGEQAMLLHLPGGQFVAYSQKCTHLSCAVYYQPEQTRLYCPCHEGVFNPQSGDPVAGPPSRRLPQITLRQEGGDIYAVGWHV